MDVLRGIAIVLVIFWHSAGILTLNDIDVPSWLVTLNEAFASYRMPILMFLSGLLLSRSLAKPLPTYVLGKIRRILWPFVLWSLINYVVIQYDVHLWSRIPWMNSYLWFLFYLLAFYAVAPFLTRIPTWILVAAPFFVSCVEGSTNGRRFLFLAGFFFLGKLFSEHRTWMPRLIASRWTWLLLIPVVPFSVAFAIYGPWRYYGYLAVFSFAGIVLAIKLAQMLGDSRVSRGLQFVGRDSIVYYVTHFPIIVAVVAVGAYVQVPVGALIVIGFVAAMSLGTALVKASRVSFIGLLFVGPAFPAAWGTAPSRLSAMPAQRWWTAVATLAGVAALGCLLLAGVRFI
jgi:fucose 4-O-acetylase-like acetyltransferase